MYKHYSKGRCSDGCGGGGVDRGGGDGGGGGYDGGCGGVGDRELKVT